MRLYIRIILFATVTISCNQRQHNTSLKNSDYLTKWYTSNEDSLSYEFNQLVQQQLFTNRKDTNWSEFAFLNEDSTKFMGRFTLATKKYCDSLQVTFFYNKETNPHTRILLSTNYNKKFAAALDSIFNPIPRSKYFIIDKYENADTATDIYSFNDISINKKELRFQVSAIDSFLNVIIFIKATPKKSLNDDQKQFFIRQLFGEEMLVKKINKVEIKFCNKIDPDLITLNDLYLKLK